MNENRIISAHHQIINVSVYFVSFVVRRISEQHLITLWPIGRNVKQHGEARRLLVNATRPRCRR